MLYCVGIINKRKGLEMKEAKKTKTIVMTQELFDQIKALADYEERSVNNVICRLLKKGLEK